LDILNIKGNRNSFEGRSFTPTILDKNKKYRIKFVFSEQGVTKIIGNSIGNAELKSIIAGEWKLIYEQSSYGVKYELYNLRNDPREKHNLVDIEKGQFEFLKARLEEWMNRPKPDITPLTKPLDEETKEKLKSLGYLQ
jgi:arylsulfatase A-like enzyme